MANIRWHDRIVSAIREMAETWGYVSMSPSKVYFRTQDGRAVHYQPDAVWVRTRKGIQIILWEAEKDPSPKALAGDLALASLCRTSFAEFYPDKDLCIGSEFRKPVKLSGTYDKRTSAQILYPEKRQVFKGNQITRLSLFVVFSDESDASYYGRYVQVLKRKRWGRRSPFYRLRAFPCSAKGVKAAKRSLGKRIAHIK